MSRKFRIDIETAWAGAGEVEYFEMPDNATEEDVASEAKEIFFNYCNYGYSEVKDEEVAEG